MDMPTWRPIGLPSGPVQQIEGEMISAETGKARRASTRDAVSPSHDRVTLWRPGRRGHVDRLSRGRSISRSGHRRTFRPYRSTPSRAKALCAALLPQRLPDVFPARGQLSPGQARGRSFHRGALPFGSYHEPTHLIAPQALCRGKRLTPARRPVCRPGTRSLVI